MDAARPGKGFLLRTHSPVSDVGGVCWKWGAVGRGEKSEDKAEMMVHPRTTPAHQDWPPVGGDSEEDCVREGSAKVEEDG